MPLLLNTKNYYKSPWEFRILRALEILFYSFAKYIAVNEIAFP